MIRRLSILLLALALPSIASADSLPPLVVKGGQTRQLSTADTLSVADQIVTRTGSDVNTTISGDAGKAKNIRLQTANNNRWVIGSSSDAEGGGNAGSTFAISRFDNSGTFIDAPFSILRSNGGVNVNGVSTFSQPISGVDLTYGSSSPTNTMKVGLGNTIAFCPDLSCVPYSAGNVVHRAGSLVLAGGTVYDAQAEEDLIGIRFNINKGYSRNLARSTAYTSGQTAVIGNAAYRATTSGTTAAGSPPPGTRPVSFPFTYVDGGVTWLWINDAAVVAKTAIYNEVANYAGGGQSWAQANNFQLLSGHTPSFNVNTELDFRNDSGTDCALGVSNCLGLYVYMQGVNKNTAAVNLQSQDAGTLFGIRSAGNFETGISIDNNGVTGLYFGQLLSTTYSSATIQDHATSPASYSMSGTNSLAGIYFGNTAPTGIDLRNGVFTNQILGTGWAVSNAGAITTVSISLVGNSVAGLGTCNAGTKYQVKAVGDANAPTWNATLSGGGSTAVLAFCNGTNWVAH